MLKQSRLECCRVIVHVSRDKILLDAGDGVDEDGDQEEEVFALRGVSSDSDDDDDKDEYPDQVSDDEQGSDAMQVDSDAYSEPTLSKSKTKAPKSTRDARKSSRTEDASDSEEEETWGRSKGAYYSSNAAQIDEEDEEANELEEQEALRLQAKSREGMCDEDFGLGDVVEGDVEPPEATYARCLVICTAAKHRHLVNRSKCQFHSQQRSHKTNRPSYAPSRKNPPRRSHSRGIGMIQPTASSRQKPGLKRKSTSFLRPSPLSPFPA